MRTRPLRGEHPAVLVPSVSHRGIPFLVGNDRASVVVVSRSGVGDTLPEFRSWTAGPPAWSEALSLQDRAQVVPFYATNERGEPVHGVLELPLQVLGSTRRHWSMEAVISGIIVTFEPRPAALQGFDGGLAGVTALGFDAQVWGIGHPNARRTDPQGRITGVFASDIETFTITAAEVASLDWPNELSVFLPCVVTQRVRGLRVRFPRINHVRIKAVEVWGHVTDAVTGTP